MLPRGTSTALGSESQDSTPRISKRGSIVSPKSANRSEARLSRGGTIDIDLDGDRGLGQWRSSEYEQWIDSKTGLLKMEKLDGLNSNQAFRVLLKSELFYVESGLRDISETYLTQCSYFNDKKVGKALGVKKVLSEQELQQIFLNISGMYKFHRTFCHELLDLTMSPENELVAGLGPLLQKFVPFFKFYAEYTLNLPKAQLLLKDLTQSKKDTAFADFCNLQECISGGPLEHLLKLPVARLPQYLMYFAHIYMNLMQPESEDGQVLAKAVMGIQRVADQIATDQKREASKQQVVDLQSTFKGIAIVEPHRFFVKKGAMKRVFDKNQKTTKGKAPKVYLFMLFNDLLMYGSPRKSKLVKHVIRVEGLQVAHLPDMQGEWQNAISIQSRIKDNHHGIWICCAATPKAKEKWLQAFKDIIGARQEELMREGARLPKEIISCKDFEDQIMGKKVRKPTMVPRPDNPIEIKKQREIQAAKEAEERKKKEIEDARRRKQQEIAWAEAEIRHWEELRQQSMMAEYAEAVYEFRATVPEAHSLSIGQLVIIVERHPTGWWKVKLSHEGHVAVVPYNYLAATDKIVPFTLQPPRLAVEILQARAAEQEELLPDTDADASGMPPVVFPGPSDKNRAMCGDCEQERAEFWCGECGLSFCGECNERFHKRGQRKRHVRERTAPAPAGTAKKHAQIRPPEDDLDKAPSPPPVNRAVPLATQTPVHRASPSVAGGISVDSGKVKELENKIHTLQVELQKEENKAKLLNMELENSKQEAERLRTLREKELSLRAGGNEEAIRLEQELSRVREEAEAQHKSLLDSAETARAALNEKIARLEDQHRVDKQALADLEAASRQGSEALDRKRQEMEAERKRKALEQEQEMARLQAKVTEYEQTLGKTNAELEAEKRELKRVRENIERQKGNLEAKIHTLENQLHEDASSQEAQLAEMKAVHNRTVSEKDAAISQLNSDIAAAKLQLEAATKEMKGAGQAIAKQLRAEADKLKEKVAVLDEAKRNAELNLENYQTTSNAKYNELQARFEMERSQLEKLMQSEKQRVEEISLTLRDREEKLANAEKERNEVRAAVNKLTAQLRDAENMMEKANLEHQISMDSLNSRMIQAQRTTEQLQAQMEKARKEYELSLSELRTQLKDAEENITKLQKALVEEQKSNAEKLSFEKGERAKLEKALASLNAELAIKEDQAVSQQSKIQSLSLQLEEKMGELRTASIEMDRLTDELDAEKKAMHYPPPHLTKEKETSQDGKYTWREFVFWQINTGPQTPGIIQGCHEKPADYRPPIPMAPSLPPMPEIKPLPAAPPAPNAPDLRPSPDLPTADIPKISAAMLTGGSKNLKPGGAAMARRQSKANVVERERDKGAPRPAMVRRVSKANVGGPVDMFSEMKNKQLKKADERLLAAPKGEQGLMGALQNSLTNYRKFVSMEGAKDSDEEEDKAFGDDEWE